MSDPDAERMAAAYRRRMAAREPHLRQLGEVLEAATTFEASMSAVLAKCLGCSVPAAFIVAAQSNAKTILETIDALTYRFDWEPIKLEPKFGGGTVDADRVREWVKLAKTASDARNRVVHSLWFIDDQGVRSGLKPRGRKDVPSEDIAKALELLEKASDTSWLSWPGR